MLDEQEREQGRCMACLRWFNGLIWASQEDILQFDFLKPAPCVQHMFLVVLRLIVSGTLCVLALVAIITTADEIGFQYLSMWTLLQSTVLFAVMAIIQVKNQRRLKKFKVEIGRESEILADTTADNIKAGHISKVDTPWRYWRWLIVIYQSSFVLSLSVLANFFITELSDDEFLIYTGSDDSLYWDLITTVPFIMLSIEYPFNQIPIGWGMILFNIILINLYLFLNFIIVSFRENHLPIYEDFDWYHHPVRCLVSYFILIGFNIVFFGGLWAVTMKFKLPAYRKRDEKRLGGLDFSSEEAKPYNSSPTAKKYSTKSKQVDLNLGHDSTRMSANMTQESNPLKDGDGKMSAAQYMGYGVDPEQRPIINASSVVSDNTVERKLSAVNSQNSGKSPIRMNTKGRIRKLRDKSVTDSRVGNRAEEVYISEGEHQDQASIEVSTRRESV